MGYGNFIGYSSNNSKTATNGGIWNSKDVYKLSKDTPWNFNSPELVAFETNITSDFTNTGIPNETKEGDIIFVICGSNGTAPPDDVPNPGGFTQIATNNTNPRYSIFYKIATSNEDGGSGLNVSATNEAGMVCVFRSPKKPTIYDAIGSEFVDENGANATASVTGGDFYSNTTLLHISFLQNNTINGPTVLDGYTEIASVGNGGVSLYVSYKRNQAPSITNTSQITYPVDSRRRSLLVSIL